MLHGETLNAQKHSVNFTIEYSVDKCLTKDLIFIIYYQVYKKINNFIIQIFKKKIVVDERIIIVSTYYCFSCSWREYCLFAVEMVLMSFINHYF